jgi:phosphoribosylformimino-5-aminoimidazole carboxamide ribonucleotide (ProFAR) isomerase
MILYPAIDLKDGQCVRLLHGDMEKATVFNTSPPTRPSASCATASRGCTWST